MLVFGCINKLRNWNICIYGFERWGFLVGVGVLLIIFGKCIEILNFYFSIFDFVRIFINYDIIMFYKDEGVLFNIL